MSRTESALVIKSALSFFLAFMTFSPRSSIAIILLKPCESRSNTQNLFAEKYFSADGKLITKINVSPKPTTASSYPKAAQWEDLLIQDFTTYFLVDVSEFYTAPDAVLNRLLLRIASLARWSSFHPGPCALGYKFIIDYLDALQLSTQQKNPKAVKALRTFKKALLKKEGLSLDEFMIPLESEYQRLKSIAQAFILDEVSREMKESNFAKVLDLLDHPIIREEKEAQHGRAAVLKEALEGRSAVMALQAMDKLFEYSIITASPLRPESIQNDLSNIFLILMSDLRERLKSVLSRMDEDLGHRRTRKTLEILEKAFLTIETQIDFYKRNHDFVWDKKVPIVAQLASLIQEVKALRQEIGSKLHPSGLK